MQRGGKLDGSSRIMRILDYLFFEKIHLNLSKSPCALGQWLKVPEKEKKEEGNTFPS